MNTHESVNSEGKVGVEATSGVSDLSTANGSSQLPGTLLIQIRSSFTPCAINLRLAPSTRGSTIDKFHLACTIKILREEPMNEVKAVPVLTVNEAALEWPDN